MRQERWSITTREGLKGEARKMLERFSTERVGKDLSGFVEIAVLKYIEILRAESAAINSNSVRRD